MTAHPTEKKKDKREGGGYGCGGEGGGFPPLIEVIVEGDKDDAEQPNEADQRAERHEEGAENFALALPRESCVALRESGHIRGAEGGKQDPVFAQRRQPQIASRASNLLEQPDGEGIFIVLAVAGLHCGENHEDYPGDPDGGGEEVEQDPDEKDEQHSADGNGQADVNGEADLEIQHFLADAVEVGAVAALDQPEHQRTKNVSVEREDKPAKAEEMHDDSEGVVGRGIRRNGGRVAG